MPAKIDSKLTVAALISSAMIFFSGCSHKNAFTKFNFDKEQELSASSIQSSKISLEGEVAGLASVIYLNDVYPKLYTKDEYFYISLYLKENKNDFSVKLNGKTPLKVDKLQSKNKFSHLSGKQSEWNRYYLVKFKKQGKRLNLVLESGQSSSAVLKYRKDQQ